MAAISGCRHLRAGLDGVVVVIAGVMDERRVGAMREQLPHDFGFVEARRQPERRRADELRREVVVL